MRTRSGCRSAGAALAWAASLALAGGACAPSLSTMRPAHVPAKGHLAAEMGFEVSLPTGALGALIDSGKTLSDDAENRELTDEEKWELFDAGTSLVLNLPGAGSLVGVEYVPVEHLELGLRKTSGAWRLGLRYQLLEQTRHPFDLTLGLSGTRYVYNFPVEDILGVVKIDPFTRYQLGVPLTMGRHGSFYRWWLGPKFDYTNYDTQVTLTLPDLAGGSSTELAGAHGSAAYFGGQLGGALGWKYVFVAAELTIMRMWSNNSLNALGQSRDVAFDGTIVYPSVALMGEF